jgi:hypothetical protein
MTSPSISNTTVASRAHRVERTAAFAALAAAALYIIQPVLVFGLTPLLPEIPEYATAAEAASATWQASLEAGLFFGIGVAFVVFAVACGRAIDPHRDGGVATQVAGGFGLLAGGAWLLFAGTFIASAGVGGWADVAAAADDADAQRAAVQVLEAVGIGTLAGIALLTAATIAAVSVAARRTRSLGLGVVVTGWVFAILIAASSILALQPVALLLVIPWLVVVAIVFLRRSRRSDHA